MVPNVIINKPLLGKYVYGRGTVTDVIIHLPRLETASPDYKSASL
jgi:hypothetical protein